MVSDVIGEIKVLKRKKDSDKALELLQRIAAEVAPIMTKRSWEVTQLCEFYPGNPNLLGCNINRGYKINIRLRPHYDDTTFLDYNDLLGTMLHELAHIVRGPHDAAFYRLLDELNDELDELILSGKRGYTIFGGEGRRLGGSATLSPLEAKQKALQAAERRRQIQSIMAPKGGVRLAGLGGSIDKTLTPSQMAARGAERRLRDQKCCGGLQTEDSVSPESDSPSSSKIPVVILSDDEEQQRTPKKRKIAEKPTEKLQQGWECSVCTFHNADDIVLACKVCLSERPIASTNDIGTGYWSCPQCTLQNEMQWWACQACDYIQPR
ncbi:hypothetical protein VTP01DRAFT_5299 [Rhizomucor pusillus]|uniref:uncharacterized protein n=1 Tax=Rhizomucor pusillus TaxID=4840 RepID=UPI0037445D60